MDGLNSLKKLANSYIGFSLSLVGCLVTSTVVKVKIISFIVLCMNCE